MMTRRRNMFAVNDGCYSRSMQEEINELLDLMELLTHDIEEFVKENTLEIEVMSDLGKTIYRAKQTVNF